MKTLLGKRIRHLREARSLTQQEIADTLSMSRQKYARIENGVHDITLEILLQLAEIFQVTVPDITKDIGKSATKLYRKPSEQMSNGTLDSVHEMLDIFFANKHIYDQMHNSKE